MTQISGLSSVWDGWDFSYLLSILLGVIPSLICITLHELSHGYVAYRLGDDTAKQAGRLTLNPINPKRGMAFTALAGPVSNVLITLVFLLLYGALFVPLRGSDVGGYFLEMIELTAYMSLGLAVFNLIPLPPLDGSKVLFALMSDESYYKLMRYERYGGLVLMVLMMTGVLGKPVSTVVSAIYSNLIPVAQFACDLVVKLFYK